MKFQSYFRNILLIPKCILKDSCWSNYSETKWKVIMKDDVSWRDALYNGKVICECDDLSLNTFKRFLIV